VHGSHQFDKLTRTKTVESILTAMSAEGIKDYIAHLLGQTDGGPASRQYGVLLSRTLTITH
jgi:DNA polymerase phi